MSIVSERFDTFCVVFFDAFMTQKSLEDPISPVEIPGFYDEMGTWLEFLKSHIDTDGANRASNGIQVPRTPVWLRNRQLSQGEMMSQISEIELECNRFVGQNTPFLLLWYTPFIYFRVIAQDKKVWLKLKWLQIR